MAITAADIMTAPAIVVRPETNMAEIASLLALVVLGRSLFT